MFYLWKMALPIFVHQLIEQVFKKMSCSWGHPFKPFTRTPPVMFQRFGGDCRTFYVICLFQYMHSESHSSNDTIQSYTSFRRGLSPFPHCTCAQWGKTSLWCRAENRTRACLPASRRATNWATPHHHWATPHHTEPRRTKIEYMNTVQYKQCWMLYLLKIKVCKIYLHLNWFRNLNFESVPYEV